MTKDTMTFELEGVGVWRIPMAVATTIEGLANERVAFLARAEAAEAALASCNRARQAAEAECEYLRSLYTHQHAIAQEEHARAKDAEAILSQTQAERDEYRAEATQYKNDLAVALETEARQARRIMTLEVHDDTPTNV